MHLEIIKHDRMDAGKRKLKSQKFQRLMVKFLMWLC